MAADPVTEKAGDLLDLTVEKDTAQVVVAGESKASEHFSNLAI